MNKITKAVGLSGIILAALVAAYAMVRSADYPIAPLDSGTLFLLLAFFLVLGSILWTTNRVGNSMLDDFMNELGTGELYESRWKYILTLTTQISVGVIVPVSFGFYFADMAGDQAHPAQTLKFVLLLLIVIFGSFFFSWEIWKLKKQKSNREFSTPAISQNHGNVSQGIREIQ